MKIVELILRYPGTNDEHFHEIYKLCLAVVCTDHRLVHHEQIIKILDLCLDQAVKHKETSHKALAHSTFLQVLSQLPRNLPSDGILQKFPEVGAVCGYYWHVSICQCYPILAIGL